MKLTPELLRSLVLEEMANFGKEKDVEDVSKDTEELGDGGYSDTLEKPIDYVKALKIEEARLNDIGRRTFNRLKEVRVQLAKHAPAKKQTSKKKG
jgi:hypothetical protein